MSTYGNPLITVPICCGDSGVFCGMFFAAVLFLFFFAIQPFSSAIKAWYHVPGIDESISGKTLKNENNDSLPVVKHSKLRFPFSS